MSNLASPNTQITTPKAFGRHVLNWTGGLDVVYHGTRYATRILTEGRFKFDIAGEAAISFSRSPVMAAYWALLPRPTGEYRGAVFVLDRIAIKSRFKLERVWGRDIDRLQLFLFAVVWEPGEIAPNLPLWGRM